MQPQVWLFCKLSDVFSKGRLSTFRWDNTTFSMVSYVTCTGTPDVFKETIEFLNYIYMYHQVNLHDVWFVIHLATTRSQNFTSFAFVQTPQNLLPIVWFVRAHTIINLKGMLIWMTHSVQVSTIFVHRDCKQHYTKKGNQYSIVEVRASFLVQTLNRFIQFMHKILPITWTIFYFETFYSDNNFNSTPHSWRHKCACKALLDWYLDKQHTMSLKNTLLESSLQKTRNPIFPCPCLCALSSQVQLHLDNWFLGNLNSLLIWTESESPGLTSYIYCKLNLENPKPRSQQCFVAPFLCISPTIPFTASDYMLCLSEIQSPNALRKSIFRQVCGALFGLFVTLLQPRYFFCFVSK